MTQRETDTTRASQGGQEDGWGCCNLNGDRILCDPGWYEVFDCMRQHEWGLEALNAWSAHEHLRSLHEGPEP